MNNAITDLDRFNRTIAAFDQANAEDPHLEEVDGQALPKEWVYGKRMSEMLLAFCPDASEALQLAARCQHIRRWTIPREQYPMDRKGYLLWRTKLKEFHAQLAASIMREQGYEEDTIDRVAFLLLKKKLKVDPETQTLEDVVCLVFLKYYFSEFTAKHSGEKLIDIVAKTWVKMSDRGHAAALTLPLSPPELAIIQRALNPG